MKRVAVACLVGSAIEFYDFLIYGTAAALVFPTVFFPHLSPAVATVASMGTFAAAFISRPLGAGVFGYFGDRLGRKKTLVATLLVMALSTVTVGLVPSAATIGGAAPLILTVLRLLQGFALGGQWAGSALLSAESAPAAKRGLFGMFTLVGGGIALILGSLTFLGVTYTVGESSPAFMQWGWRIPFLISAVLIVIALYVRLNINETPVFAREKIRPNVPVVEVLRRQRREMILAAGSTMTCFGFVYLASAYLASYAHANLGYSRSLILFDGVLGGLTCIVFGAFAAVLSDQVGRRRIVLIAWAAALPWSFVVMPLIDSGDPTLFAVALVGMYAIASFGYGPVPAFLPELFATRWRYTGTALSVNLAGIVGGTLPPLLAGTLAATCGSWAIGLMLAGFAVTSLVCTYLLPETAGTALASS
ncbi:Inner membrane metabolite transport protein YhjE [Mycobacterium simulans]|uniref:MFS transporter n=1 Tax=Mycobacterium simulans TaxID=627089 RepID=UPI001749574D|nr:MFS transporter [Mycobacterium simulans]SON61248.1 Inner membrane metabolite transport protein YhjE [Mycobacterium simulans]